MEKEKEGTDKGTILVSFRHKLGENTVEKKKLKRNRRRKRRRRGLRRGRSATNKPYENHLPLNMSHKWIKWGSHMRIVVVCELWREFKAFASSHKAETKRNHSMGSTCECAMLMPFLSKLWTFEVKEILPWVLSQRKVVVGFLENIRGDEVRIEFGDNDSANKWLSAVGFRWHKRVYYSII